MYILYALTGPKLQGMVQYYCRLAAGETLNSGSTCTSEIGLLQRGAEQDGATISIQLSQTTLGNIRIMWHVLSKHGRQNRPSTIL